jgi:Carboxypeptidase regulatory-like domain
MKHTRHLLPCSIYLLANLCSLTAQQTVVLFGNIKNAAHIPVAGAAVTVTCAAAASKVKNRAVTNAEGHFYAVVVCPDSILVEVVATGYQSHRHKSITTDTDTIDLGEIILSPANV